jgi:hypothetical protein
MNKLILVTIISSVFLSAAMATDQNKPAAPQATVTKNVAGDHNSTRSNRGSLAAPNDTNETDNDEVDQLHDISKPKKGRNPQTGKEINVSKSAKRTGRNPQTGKEIDITKKK